jgi:hypothetical protein
MGVNGRKGPIMVHGWKPPLTVQRPLLRYLPESTIFAAFQFGTSNILNFGNAFSQSKKNLSTHLKVEIIKLCITNLQQDIGTK